MFSNLHFGFHSYENGFSFRILKWHPLCQVTLMTLDIGFELGLRGFIGG